MIENINNNLSIEKQCEMVNVSRSSYYNYIKAKEPGDEIIKESINLIYLKHPEYGSRRITEILKRAGVNINRKRTQRLMRELGIHGIYQKPKTSILNKQHLKFPYIARDKPIIRINQVWSTDITYLKTIFGQVYLVAIIDWHSRFVLSWQISNTLCEEFCIDALNRALINGKPEIFNTDQGSQFTGRNFISILENNKIRPSMDGKGRATDNAPIERFWKSVKWEEVYLYEPKNYIDLKQQIKNYIKFYNHERPHQSINYKTPSEVHFDLDKKLVDFNYEVIYTSEELKFVENYS